MSQEKIPIQAAISSPKAKLVEKYFHVQVETSSPDQILLLLLDGAVRFVEGALEAAGRKDFEKKNALLIKAQAIVMTLKDSLQPEIGQQIFRNLGGLYFFIYQKLVEGNFRNDRNLIAEGLKLLQEVRETWRQAVASFRKEKAAGQEQKSTEQQGICITG